MYLSQEQANDKDLIRELAGQMIQDKAHDVRALNGHIAYNYEINHKWIFKLPSFRTNPDLWIAQSQYMPKLQQQLKYQIPVPKIQHFGLPQGKVIGCCYPKIQGKIFSKSNFCQLSLSQKGGFFEELAQAIEQLHAVSPDSLGYSFNDTIEQLSKFLFKDVPDKEKLFTQRIKKSFHERGISLKNDLLCHTDLHANNVVLDSRNHIVGLLDFDGLSLGDSFMEFRPNLYDSKDLNLLRHIYQQKTTHPIDVKATKCMEELYEQAFLFYSLGSFVKSANTRLKPKTELISKKEISHIFKTNTDHWSHFGRD